MGASHVQFPSKRVQTNGINTGHLLRVEHNGIFLATEFFDKSNDTCAR